MIVFDEINSGSTVNIELVYKKEDGTDIDLAECSVTFTLVNESNDDVILEDVECDPSHIVNISDTISSSLSGWYELSVRIDDNGFIDIRKARLNFIE